MKSIDKDTEVILINMINQDEGYRQFVYNDTGDIPTIGYGRNLKNVGISKSEAEFLRNNDLNQAEEDLIKGFPSYNSFNAARKAILIEMCYNMGYVKLMGFKNFIKYALLGDYTKSALEMLNSLWAKQVNYRAQKLAYYWERGSFE